MSAFARGVHDAEVAGALPAWVEEVAYNPTWAGSLYLAVVLDTFSRRVVGWSMETHLRRASGVVHHRDQGCQYTSIAFGQRCKQAGVRPAMGSVGDCFDNAMCENSFATQAEARLAVSDFIESWYDPWRRHSALGYDSPVRFERRHEQACLPSQDPSTEPGQLHSSRVLLRGGDSHIGKMHGGRFVAYPSALTPLSSTSRDTSRRKIAHLPYQPHG